MFEFLWRQDLVLLIEPAGTTWQHLFRETFTTPDGIAHTNTALGCGTAGSRFSDPRAPAQFRVWYWASEFRSAFLETVVRDAGVGIGGAIPISWEEIFGRRWSEVAAVEGLRLVDLSEDGCTRMRINTGVAGARSHRLARQLSVVLHDHPSVPDGVRFRSRLTGRPNVAVYDRAFGKLGVSAEGPLYRHVELPGLIDRYHLSIKRRPRR